MAEQTPADLGQQVEAALREDIGSGDVTAVLVPAAQRVRGSVITREDAVLCGRAWADETFRRLDPQVRLGWHAADGDRIAATQVIFEITGAARPVLTGERTALNFLQVLSGTATATRRFDRFPVANRSVRTSKIYSPSNRNRFELFVKMITASPMA